MQAYRRLAKAHHPDKPGGSAARFAKVQDAFATLADPKKRLVYDTWARELRFRYIDAHRVRLARVPDLLLATRPLDTFVQRSHLCPSIDVMVTRSFEQRSSLP